MQKREKLPQMVAGRLGEFAGIDRSGLYVLRAPCLSSPVIYKIGKTLNLRKRLDQYQLYFPFGFLVDLLWIFPRGLGNGKVHFYTIDRV